jgi:hypothetical protein
VGAPARAVEVASTTADVQVTDRDGYLAGWSLRESSGTPAVATAILRDGTADTDPILAVVELAANASSTVALDHPLTIAGDGVFLEVAAGEVEGSVWVA